MENKNNLYAIISLVSSIVGLLVYSFFIYSLKLQTLMIIGFIIMVCAILLGFIGKSQIAKNEGEKKGMAIAGIVIGFLGAFFYLSGILTASNLDDPEITMGFCIQSEIVSNCVDNGDDTAKCTLLKKNEVICKTEYLKEEQFKTEN